MKKTSGILSVIMIIIGIWVLLETSELGPKAIYEQIEENTKPKPPGASFESPVATVTDIPAKSAVGLGAGVILISSGSWLIRKNSEKN